MKTDHFQSCGHCCAFQICWHIACSTFTASSFRSWNSSTGIPSPSLPLFIVMLSKVHHIPRCLALCEWSHHCDYLHHEDLVCTVLCIFCHLFLISYASVRSVPFLSFIEPIFAWNIPLVSLIFLKKSLVFPIAWAAKCRGQNSLAPPRALRWNRHRRGSYKMIISVEDLCFFLHKINTWVALSQRDSTCVRPWGVHRPQWASEIAQSYPTLAILWTVNLPRSFVHGIFSRQEYWNGMPFPFSRGSSWPQRPNPGLPHCREMLYHLSHQAWATNRPARHPSVRVQGIPARG